MKRFYFIAAMAIMAAACQKTEIQNEVQTPIGFSTEVGKQTRAIVDGQGADYKTDQPFAVYAYGHQAGTTETITTVMDNVEISYTAGSGEGPTAVPAKWSATGTTKYYWPNDPNTTLNFYAYSPALVTNGTATTDDQKLNGNIDHNETGTTVGLSLTGYKHTNMYVDFMVATPVIGAKFSASDPNGLTTAIEPAGTVPVVFNHQMTQILFNVTTDKVYPGVTFTVESIKLENVKNTGDYTHSNLIPSYDFTSGTFTHGEWENQEVMDNSEPYVIFPATGESEVELAYATDATSSTPLEVMTTTGVTMIPQNMVQVTTDVTAGADTYANQTVAQMFEITYSIEGTGVATETVTKHVPFFAYSANSAVNWGVNQKITYTVKIGLNEILFEPTVADWTETPGTDYTFQQ